LPRADMIKKEPADAGSRIKQFYTLLQVRLSALILAVPEWNSVHLLM